MTRRADPALLVIALGSVASGCATAPIKTAGAYATVGAHATYHAAATGASAMTVAGVDIYNGAGRAIKAPLHDFNVMQDKIDPVLLRAEAHPYDMSGLDSCNDVLDKVAALDLALGPDLDTPKGRRRTRVSLGADFAASAALDAAGSAAEHFIPMRSTIKQITGATRYEDHVKHAVLAGEIRRSFLKAIGMQHDCVWPAAPLEFTPTRVADTAASWRHADAVVLAAAPVAPSAAAAAPIRTAAPTSPRAAEMAALGGARSPAPAIETLATEGFVAADSRAGIAPPGDAAQTWRASSASLMQVSTTSTAAAAAPWAGFAGTAGRH